MFENMPKWDVQVLFGAGEVSADGPVGFGAAQVFVGPEGMSALSVPLIYENVYIRSFDGWMGVQTPNDDGTIETHRELWRVFSIEFNDWGVIRVTGAELGDDGVLHAAAWELSPVQVLQEDT